MDIERYLIRRAEAADVPKLLAWRRADHVRRWWGDPASEPEAEKLSDPLVACWIVEGDGRALGFIQDYAVSDWPPHHFDYLPAGARGMDLYIGEVDALGQGHGARMVRQHVDGLLRWGIPAVGIDPHPDNLRAQKCFARAGFIAGPGPVQTRWGPAMLMHRYAGT